jgi:hypothetical protein
MLLLAYARNYGKFLLVAAVCFVVLAHDNLWVNAAQAAFWTVWAYAWHRLLHALPAVPPNVHMWSHHDKKFTDNRALELALETASELASLAVPWLFWQGWNRAVCVFVGGIYILAHIANYSIFGSDLHREHHDRGDVNFGPDPMDKLFGTSSSREPEDANPMIPDVLLAFWLAWGTGGLRPP